MLAILEIEILILLSFWLQHNSSKQQIQDRLGCLDYGPYFLQVILYIKHEHVICLLLSVQFFKLLSIAYISVVTVPFRIAFNEPAQPGTVMFVFEVIFFDILYTTCKISVLY